MHQHKPTGGGDGILHSCPFDSLTTNKQTKKPTSKQTKQASKQTNNGQMDGSKILKKGHRL